MSGIAIYAEGGFTAEHKAQLRQGLDRLLGAVKTAARNKRIGWKVVFSGDRRSTYDAFINAVKSNSNATNILLVDSEEEIAAYSGSPDNDAKVRSAHLVKRDGWDLSKAIPERVHLMVQCMESWIIADPDALEQFYGQGFVRGSLPTRQNLEAEPKKDVYEKLAKATKQTKKGEYHKIKHAAQLLLLIDSSKVADRCPRFLILANWLNEVIGS